MTRQREGGGLFFPNCFLIIEWRVGHTELGELNTLIRQ